jgi:hypothetical protein
MLLLVFWVIFTPFTCTSASSPSTTALCTPAESGTTSGSSFWWLVFTPTALTLLAVGVQTALSFISVAGSAAAAVSNNSSDALSTVTNGSSHNAGGAANSSLQSKAVAVRRWFHRHNQVVMSGVGVVVAVWSMLVSAEWGAGLNGPLYPSFAFVSVVLYCTVFARVQFRWSVVWCGLMGVAQLCVLLIHGSGSTGKGSAAWYEVVCVMWYVVVCGVVGSALNRTFEDTIRQNFMFRYAMSKEQQQVTSLLSLPFTPLHFASMLLLIQFLTVVNALLCLFGVVWFSDGQFRDQLITRVCGRCVTEKGHTRHFGAIGRCQLTLCHALPQNYGVRK